MELRDGRRKKEDRTVFGVTDRVSGTVCQLYCKEKAEENEWKTEMDK